jgi:uncharacterized protein
MTKTIRPAAGLSFPAAEFACEVSAAIGNRGGGKSNGVAVVVEQMLDAEIPVVVLDYVGIWFSLRLQPDGKAPSRFQIPVLGGKHGDLDLSPTTGAVVAEALAERHASAVLDISMFTKGDRCRFATDFAEAFFRAKKSNPGPAHLVLEEAQRFIPQRIQPDQARMLGAFEEIAEVGRNFGIGMSLVSQRPQKLAKDVLNLADTLFAYRTNGVLERKALDEWVQEKGADGKRDIANELPGLERGRAIVWCPARRVYGQYQMPLKSTYDAGATPLQARAAVQTKPLDLGELKVAMGRVVEEAKAHDPRALKTEIARLKAELGKTTAASTRETEKLVNVLVVPPEWVAEVREAIATLAHLKDQVFREIGKQVDYSTERLSQMVHLGAKYKPAAAIHARASVSAPRPVQAQRRPQPAGNSEVGNSGLRRMLVALAQRPNGLTNGQLGVRAGVSSKSGTFSTYLSRARARGWIADDGQIRRITDDGIDALGSYDPLPEGADLARYWINELGGGASRMLQALLEAYPLSLTNAELGERAGISAGSGTFSTYLSRLRALELVTGRGGQLCASEELV